MKKFENPMNYVLFPTLVVAAIVWTYLNVGTDILDGQPDKAVVYWIMMAFFAILAGVGVWGEWLYRRGGRNQTFYKEVDSISLSALHIPCFYFGYYDKDKSLFDYEKLKKGVELVSCGQVSVGSACLEGQDFAGALSYYALQEMTQRNLVTEVSLSTKTEELAEKLNRVILKRLMAEKKLILSGITAEQIAERDTWAAQKCRVAGIPTPESDVNAADAMLREQGYALVHVLQKGHTLCLTVVTMEELEELRKIEKGEDFYDNNQK